jgi:rubrerythrin
VIDEVRIIGAGGHAFKLALPLTTSGHLRAAHRTRRGCTRHGVTVLAALPTRWTCASCGTSFVGPKCPNCNGVAA